MESRTENLHGTEIPRKPRSLDLKSLYDSTVRKHPQAYSSKRKASADDGDGSGDNKKKCEESLSSAWNTNNSSRKSSDKVHNSGVSSGSHDQKDLNFCGDKKLSGCNGLDSSLSLDNNVIQIPRHKRGSVGRKRFENGKALKEPGQSSSKLDLPHQESKLNGNASETQIVSCTVKQKKLLDDSKDNRGSKSSPSRRSEENVAHSNDSGTQIQSCKIKRKKLLDDLMENRSSKSSLSRHSKKDLTSPKHVVEDCDLSMKGSRKNSCKRKDVATDSKTVGKEAESLVDNSKMYNDYQVDDEENLEENAMMMLSSRFDPSCTGFSSSNKASVLQSANGISFLLSSGRKFAGQRSKTSSGSESPSYDAAGRVLRPRKHHKEKGQSRKRRHFYEIFLGDLDVSWVLNRRIKVFWPLDHSWYYGLVNDYDKERELHHVKYDDLDEEWINLHNERFKLLLLPNEVPGRPERRKSKVQHGSSDGRNGSSKRRREKENHNLAAEEDSCIGSSIDSEPIISWLARSTNMVKSPSHAMKKQKTSGQSLRPVSPLSSEASVDLPGHLKDGSFKRDISEVSRCSDLPERHVDNRNQEKSFSESTIFPKDRKMPIVYFRRRFRKKGIGLSHVSEDNQACRSMFGSVTSFAPLFDKLCDLKEQDFLLGASVPWGSMWSADDEGLLKLTLSLTESREFKFHLSIPLHSILDVFFDTKHFWLSNAALLRRYGTIMVTWPKVHLEMLFVDNLVGLRFLLFESCLREALSFIFLVLTVFQPLNDQGKHVDFELPVTSIRFKLTCFQHFKRKIVFAFYNFSEVKDSKWVYLDDKLKRHCLLTKKLPLTECTFDNIQRLQNGTNLSPSTSISQKPYAIKKKSRQGFSFMAMSGNSSNLNMHRYSSADTMYKKLPPLALSFAAAPTFFISLHLKLLMEHSLTHASLRDHDSVEHQENTDSLMLDVCSSRLGCSNKKSENKLESLLSNMASNACLPCGRLESGTADGDWVKSSRSYQNGDVSVAGFCANFQVPERIETDASGQLQAWQNYHMESDLCSLSNRDLADRDKSDNGSKSIVHGLSVEIPPFDQYDKPLDGKIYSATQPTDISCNTVGGFFPSPNPTAPRSTWHRNRSNSSSFSYSSNGWSDGKNDIFYNSFGNGPRRPRTQVSYSLPFGAYEFNSKQKNIQKLLPHKRIRRASEKRSLDALRGSQRNLELLSCDANVLITDGDRGWRECGAHIVLELFDHNEWRLAVRLSGSTKFLHKAHQFLQPGSTNRFTHAMMWKGGKNWTLEFPDRSQWALFKLMHEECYDRNVRAASVKNIPIPGVRIIEESGENGMGSGAPFVRSSTKYYRQVEADVQMALNPSRVLYDMDSDDERWILNFRSSSELKNDSLGEISEERFEKTMDMLEKAAYAQQRNSFSSDEIEELLYENGSMDVIKAICEHWHQKRQKVGMPLIRHLQGPLWQRYQQQMKDWELASNNNNITLSNGCLKKTSIEKPPMYAFCFKPRGLEVPNKGSKYRSHRKVSVAGSGQSNSTFLEQDGFNDLGRRLIGFAFGDEKVVYPANSYESLDDSPLAHTSPRIFSSKDGGSMSFINNDFSDRNFHKLHSSKSKKYGRDVSDNDPHIVASYGHGMPGNRNGIQSWNIGLSDWTSKRHLQPEGSQRYVMEQFDGSDIDEYKLLDASGAAKHARNVAKLKRDKAQRLLCRADIAIHKAVAAIMTAEAMKASSEDSDSDGKSN